MAVLLRVILFIGIVLVSIFWVGPWKDLVAGMLGFKEICDGFLCFQGLETELLAIILSWSLWFGIIFGTLGKKSDYLLISITFIFTFFLFTQESGKTLEMFFGLIAITAIGNAIGFGLKLLRQRFFK